MNNIEKIGIVGLGYVGLPLAIAFAKNYTVIGFDVAKSRIDELVNGKDSTGEIESSELERSTVELTTDSNALKSCDCIIVTVPTPVDRWNKPDLEPLRKASKLIGKVMGKGTIVVYESTVYPGVTEEECVPILEMESGYKFNRDFYCGYSPERINPGDKVNRLSNIKKVVSGSNQEVSLILNELYGTIITAGTHLAPSIKVAEASKVIENTQRDVNIALINELSMIFNEMNISTIDVIEAAATKWNFIKLMPGLVGGHCIGVDPYYLTFKAEELGYKPNLILASRQINNGMAKFIVEETIKTLIDKEVPIKGAKALIKGVTFKENCPDTRNTKVTDLIYHLNKFKVDVYCEDPFAERSNVDMSNLKWRNLDSDDNFDLVIYAVAHDQYKGQSKKDIQRELNNDNIVIIDLKSIVSDADWRL